MNDQNLRPDETRPEATEAPSGYPTAAPRRVAIQLPDFNPVVVYGIMGFTILVFLLQLASKATFGGVDLPAVFGMKINDRILQQHEYWRFFTPMLLHGSILHIGFNMYALNAFGKGLERHYGHGRFLLLYVLSGFAGNVMSFLFSDANSLGSSTAIFGLLAAEAVFLYQNRDLIGQNARAALMNLFTIAAVNLVIGLSPGIDNWGHVGGLIGGALFAWTAGPILHWEGIAPTVRLSDRRESGEVLRTSLSVAFLFVLLAVATIYLRTRGS